MKSLLPRRLALAAGLVAALVLEMQSPAVGTGLVGGGGGQIDPCAAERAPILERQKQYEAVRRSKLSAALGAGLKKGAMFFAGQMVNRYLPTLGGTAPATGIPVLTLLNPANLAEAGKLEIPGVTTPAGAGAFGGAIAGSSDTRAMAAMAVVVAIVGTVEAYVQLKEQEAAGDTIRLATSIDEDAGRQIEVNHAIAAEEAALSACRTRQAADYKGRLSAASNADDRHALARDKTALQASIKKDVDLTGGVVDQQAGLAKTYTQGRAMAEGKSEADVLGGQAPAYAAAASTTPLKLPPPPNGKPVQPTAPPPPLPSPTWNTTQAATLRAAPNTKARVVANVDAGARVEVAADAQDNAGWTPVTVAGKAGYLRTSGLKKTTPTGPTLAAPSNIREHNRAVLAARDEGPNRLKTLLTDVQAG
jgi:uncharacterized protein YgiM (DUF1202 family)